MGATKRKPQKVVITLTDTDVSAGMVDLCIDFKPTMKGTDQATPAMRLALKFLELMRSQSVKGSTAVTERRKT